MTCENERLTKALESALPEPGGRGRPPYPDGGGGASQLPPSVEPEPELEPTEDPEEPPEEPEKPKGNMLPALILVVALLGGGGFFAFRKLKDMKKQQAQDKPDPDADYVEDEDQSDFDLPDDYDGDDEDSSFDAEDNEPV